MARNLLQERPMETVMPTSRSTRAAISGQRLGGGRRLGAVVVGEVEIGFVEGDRLDDGGGGGEDGADVLAHPLVLGHVGGNDGGVRAQLQRLEHRHGRAGAELAGDVAGRRHHAASAGVADDDRLLGQLGPVALLDGGVEGVAVDVGDAERGDLGVGDEALAGARGADRRRGGDDLAAIAAQERGIRAPWRAEPATGRRRRPDWRPAVVPRAVRSHRNDVHGRRTNSTFAALISPGLICCARVCALEGRAAWQR